MPGLHTEVVGAGRPGLVFLHGLFGRGRNWTSVARALAAQGRASVLFDLPNHGSSPWTTDFGYQAMADAVGDELELRLGSAARVTVVGHSMGGKVAMLLALTRPQLVGALAVIDIAPAASEGAGGFEPLIAAMRTVDLAALTSRTQAEATLEPLVPDASVRQLLLQNLRARPIWHWQPNLELLETNLDAIAGWPDPGSATYSGPVLWLTGGESDYVRPEHADTMRKLFWNVRHQVVPGAGHWVHADHPQAVIAALLGLGA
jgi:pimeloyl-ACP methyl ester carboxylesterase